MILMARHPLAFIRHDALQAGCMGIGRQYLFGYFADLANGQTNFGI